MLELSALLIAIATFALVGFHWIKQTSKFLIKQNRFIRRYFAREKLFFPELDLDETGSSDY